MDYQDRLMEYVTFVRDSAPLVGAIFLLVAVVIGSGSFSASISEVKQRNPVAHFIVGCLIPVVYPVFIFFTMTVKQKGTRKQEKEEDVHRMEGAPPADGPPVIDQEVGPTMIDEAALGNEVIQFDQQYFKQLAHDDRGNFRGPFAIVVEGNELKVERIADALDNVVVLENINADGKTQRLRIPYGKIESCTELV